MRLITPAGILVTVAFLALYGAVSLWVAWQEQSWVMLLPAIAALVTCVAAALMRRWSRFLVYVLSIGLIAEWVRSMYAAYRVGMFSLLPHRGTTWSLVYGVVLIVLACYCCFMAYRHFGAARPNI